MSHLHKTAIANHSGDPSTKPLYYYQTYDDFLNHHQISPDTILEIGTYAGESTKVFSTAFPDAQILTLDLNLRSIDFSSYPNVKYERADQADPDGLLATVTRIFPKGVHLVIDDASHQGGLSAMTFGALFPHLVSGGAYFVEDWGTGYWDSFIDGSRYQSFPLDFLSNSAPKRLPSHDFGMVGFVKSLVDLTHETAIKDNENDSSIHSSRVKALEFREGVCMLVKA